MKLRYEKPRAGGPTYDEWMMEPSSFVVKSFSGEMLTVLAPSSTHPRLRLTLLKTVSTVNCYSTHSTDLSTTCKELEACCKRRRY
ncbi:unnamed protein product [Haemonchus placei]|uniref:Uncharacterized protein n=1 Tax=Haemonchus placei TaxID=6290 RepID=A0A0N4W7I0_HAEPC|nr:unnamed protein product [Haemonchus placei]